MIQSCNRPALRCRTALRSASTLDFADRCSLSPPIFTGFTFRIAIPFYRVGFYSNIGSGTCTPGLSSIYAEVGLRPGDLDSLDLTHDLQPKVVRTLESLGWVDSRDIVCIVTHVMRHDAVRLILNRLKEHDVYPIGRYGLWDYTSMEDSMESARAAVCEVRECNLA
jgi:hypothetical protein